jgi:CDP-paratose 2-epimerase
MAKTYLITGGAGFIGANYTARLLRRGETVIVYDSLVRAGAEKNLAWLREEFGPAGFRLVKEDVRDAAALAAQVRQADVVVHLASQVAVTTSVQNPRHDFEVNALGTLNVLEAARLAGHQPVVIYASTNKVYGGMQAVEVIEEATSYRYAAYPEGISETYPLDFHSPYGCSKGAGDQYVRDYYRIYGLPTVVMRMSCIYGPRQFGIEDQGWVAWMVIAAQTGRPITIYGDGKQVRDLLNIEDLLDAYDAAQANIDVAGGNVYNLGGGPQNTLAVWQEFGPLLEELAGKPIPVAWEDWRPGDQRIFVADVRKAALELNWQPRTMVRQGISQLYDWVRNHLVLFTAG